MLNIGKLARGQQDYYLNSVAKGVEDYYLGSGEAPGYWLGGGSTDLGLEGRVLERELTMVLEGRHPDSGDAMTRRHHKTRMPGFDLTLRAPKSVALLHALGPAEASNEVVNAHDHAVHQALSYLEAHASHGRRGTDGVDAIGSSGFVAAAFRHRTSRAGDPLLHTHTLVANLIHGDDDRWCSLDGRLIYSHAKTAGYLYQAELRHELSRRLGVQWTQVRNGSAEIDGVPRPVIDAFSRRRAEIRSRMEARGEHSAKAAQVATLDTRRAKDFRVVPEGLRPEWERRADELGFSRADLAATLGRAPKRITAADKSRLHRDLLGPAGLTAHASTFSIRDVIQGLCEGAPAGATVAQIEADARALLASEQAVALGVSPQDRGLTSSTVLRLTNGKVVPATRDDPRYTTKDLLAVEKRLIERAVGRASDDCAMATVAALDEVLNRRPSLSKEQRDVIGDLCANGMGVDVVIGKAGTGKTFALDAVREAWEASGIKVIGCALSARAAKELEAGSGIQSFTLHGLLKDLDDPDSPGLKRDSVVVLDEAGMVGTRRLDALLTHAERADAKVVLVGDDKQLPEIAAGGAFRALATELNALELTEVRRQRHGWERAALDLIRDGKATEALETYTDRGRVVLGRDAEQTRALLVSDWWEARADGSAVMIAARRADVDDLNLSARALLAADGALGEVEVTVAGRAFAVGDEVMTLRNDRRLGVVNGTRGVIADIDETSGGLTVDIGDRAVAVPASYLEAGHLTHAYAITGHKAQGMTVDHALVLGDESIYREWSYVAMSRGREDNRLYVVMSQEFGRDDVGGAIERPAELDLLVRSLERSHGKTMASEHDLSTDTGALRAERDGLRQRLAQPPPDVISEMMRTDEERGRLRASIQEERERRADTEQRFAEMGKLSRVRHRDEVERLQQQIDSSTKALEHLTRDLEHFNEKQHGLDVRQDQHDRFIEEHAMDIRRLDRIEAELGERDLATLRGIQADPPSYIENTLGDEPSSPEERSAWRKAVVDLESYREAWGIGDPADALGTEPKDEVQRLHRARVEGSIQRVKQAGIEKPVDRSVELELSLEL